MTRNRRLPGARGISLHESLNDSGYAYAKAAWIIGKSFLGKRISLLANIHTLHDLEKLVFPDNYKELPGRELLVDIEKRITDRAVKQIYSVVNSYEEPPKLLVRMLKSFEYSDLKECISHIAGGNKEMPKISDIGRFKTVSFNAYPDIVSMIKKTEFEFLLSEDLKSIKQGMGFSNPAWKSINLMSVETKLDHHFYRNLLDSLSELPDEEQEDAVRLIADEISLRNCVWALRLRTYYQKTEIETIKYLMDLKLPAVNKIYNAFLKRSSLCAESRASLSLPLDVRAPWHGWRWERFLNPEEPSVHWTCDPRHFQNAASFYINHLAYHNFHSSPMSISALYCFIKLKLFEEDLLTSVAEGISLGMDSTGIFKLLEIN